MSALHVELLTKAREIVASHPVRCNAFICIALMDARRALCRGGQHNHDALGAATGQIISHIRHEVGGQYDTLETWLRSRGYDAPDPGYCMKSAVKLRATRLAWIDWLIEEWRDAP